MSGYLHALEWTGNAAVDGILDAVSDAGDRYHHTEYWGEDAYGDGSPISKISAAAAKAALEFTAAIARAEAAERERDTALATLARVDAVINEWSQSAEALIGEDGRLVASTLRGCVYRMRNELKGTP